MCGHVFVIPQYQIFGGGPEVVEYCQMVKSGNSHLLSLLESAEVSKYTHFAVHRNNQAKCDLFEQ